MVEYRTNTEGLLEVFHEPSGGYTPLMTLLQITGGLKTALTSDQIAIIDNIAKELTEIKQSNANQLTTLIQKQEQLITGTLEISGVSVARLVENCRLLIAGINQTLNTINSKQDQISGYLYSDNTDLSLIQEAGNIFDELESLTPIINQLKNRLDEVYGRLDFLAKQSQVTTIITRLDEIKALLPDRSAPILRHPYSLVTTTSGSIPVNHVYCSILARTGQVTLTGTNISNLVIPAGEAYINEQIPGEVYSKIDYVPTGQTVIYYKM